MHKIYKRKLARLFHRNGWCLFIPNEAHASAFELLFQREHVFFFFPNKANQLRYSRKTLFPRNVYHILKYCKINSSVTHVLF